MSTSTDGRDPNFKAKRERRIFVEQRAAAIEREREVRRTRATARFETQKAEAIKKGQIERCYKQYTPAQLKADRVYLTRGKA